MAITTTSCIVPLFLWGLTLTRGFSPISSGSFLFSPKHSTQRLFSSPSNLPDLTNDEISRYSRHLVLGNVGMSGQKALKAASVLVVGAGGLGSPCLMYLAAAGVGHIGLVDADEGGLNLLRARLSIRNRCDKAVEDLVVSNFGEEKWQAIKAKA